MMNKKHGWKWRTFLTAAGAGSALAAGTAFAVSESDKPRPENYAGYSQYIQALFEYRRAHDDENSASSFRPCRADRAETKEEDLLSNTKKQNTCKENRLSGGNTTPDGQGGYEDLDEAVARASAGIRPDYYTDTSANPRSTFSSFPLSPIAAQDLSLSGVNGLLGIFGRASLSLPSSTYTYTSANLQPNTDVRQLLDLFTLIFGQQLTGSLLGQLHLDQGYAIVNASSTITDTGGLNIRLSAEARTRIYVVDRDGIPGTAFSGAGAVVIDSVGINIPMLEVDIQGAHASSDSGLVQVQAYSPGAITIDLSNTHIGVADALRDGSRIGTATNFLAFGPQSALTIAPGTRITTTITPPNGTITPFATINGHVGDIALGDISLINNDESVLHIGQVAIRNIELVNTMLFIDDDKVIIDAGSGLNDVNVDMERLYLGNASSGGYVGDFYLSHANISKLRVSIAPH